MGNCCSKKLSKGTNVLKTQDSATNSQGTIVKEYKNVTELKEDFRSAGIEDISMVIGVDTTFSNKENGQLSFSNRCLHDLLYDVHRPPPPQEKMNYLNYYQLVIWLIVQTLSDYDTDQLIPFYRFGCTLTRNVKVLPARPVGDALCHGFPALMGAYEELAAAIQGQRIHMSGPTSFAPIINEAIRLTKEEGGFHLLIIITDGCIDYKEDVQQTTQSILEAQKFGISIVAIKVGDGDVQLMKRFDDHLKAESKSTEKKFLYDNFQFVDLKQTLEEMKTDMGQLAFAIQVLKEVPTQYKKAKALDLILPAKIVEATVISPLISTTPDGYTYPAPCAPPS
jgi:hypothetical protein